MIAILKIDRSDLERALKIASTAIDATGASPLLTMALLRIGERVEVTSTDLTTTTTVRIDCDATGDAEVLVDVKTLLAAVHAFPAGPLHVEIDDAKLSGLVHPLHKASNRYTFMLRGARDFPAIQQSPARMFVGESLMDAAGLRRILAAARVAAAKDLGHLAVVRLETENGLLSAIATDGHRLHVSTTEHDGEAIECMVTTRSVDAILRMLGEQCRVAVDDKWLFVSSADVLLSAKLSQEVYPPWRQVVPQPGKVSWFDAAELSSALARMLLVTGKEKATRVDSAEHGLMLSADDGTRSMSAEVACVGGDWSSAQQFAVNARYLLDAVESLGVEEIGIQHQSKALEPLLVTTRDNTGQCVVMPMRV